MANRWYDQFLRLGETSNNNISGNLLHGDEFQDFNDFDPATKLNKIDSNIKSIRAIGLREDAEISQAKKVIHLFFGDICK